MAVFLGLPWLAAVLGSLLTGLVTWLAAIVTKRIAIVIAVVVALGVLTAAFIVAIEALVSGFVYTFPFSVNVGMLIPADFTSLVAAYTAARVLFWVYHWNVKLASLWAQ